MDLLSSPQSAESAEQQLARERDRLRVLLEVSNAVVSHLSLKELLSQISACLRRLIPHDFAGIALCEPDGRQLRVYALDFPHHRDLFEVGVLVPMGGNPSGLAIATRQPVLIRNVDLREFPCEAVRRAAADGLKSCCNVPLISHDRVLGTMDLASLREAAFTEEDAQFLEQIAKQVAIAVANALAVGELEALKNKLAAEKNYLEGEIQTAYDFEQIIGRSAALKRILKQVETVASTNSTVLICGEGKVK